MSNNILDQELAAADHPAGPITYASFWGRVGASLIDFVVLLPLFIISYLNLFNAKIFAVQAAIALLSYLYRPLLEWQYRATVGKMALKQWVTNERYERITLSQALVRSAPYLLVLLAGLYTNYLLFRHADFAYATTFMDLGRVQQDSQQGLNTIAMIVWIISCLWVAIDSRNQALHDKLARTFVIERPKRSGS